MHDIITLLNGTPVTTTQQIAIGTDSDHKSVIQLARTYLADLEEFGGVAFEMLPFDTAGGRQTAQVALLNADQCTLLLTYMRNTDIVRHFKKSLIKAFSEFQKNAVAQLPNFNNPAEAARAWAAEYEAKTVALVQLEAAKPAIEFVDRYVDSTGLKGFRQVAKLLNIKEPDLRAFLDDKKIMYKLGGEWVPYADHIAAGRFSVKAGTADNGHAFNTARFTPKGIQWLAGEIAKDKVSKSTD